MMKANGSVSLCSPINHDDNQIHSSNKSSPSSSSTSSSSRRPSGPFTIKLANPPIYPRQANGTNSNDNSNNNTPSQRVNSLLQDQSPLSEQPPPIPPRFSLVNTTNKPSPGQWTRPGVTPVKAPRRIFRSRNVKQRDPNSASTNVRSDSADALSVPTVERRQRISIHRRQVQSEQATNSD